MLAPILVLYFASSAALPSLPPGKGKALIQRTCVNCHALKVVTSKRASREQWSALIDQMVSRGAELEDEDIDTVVNYLAKNFGLNKAPASATRSAEQIVNVNQANAAELATILHLSSEQADAMVAYRQKNGKFKDRRDLAKVPGIQASDIESKKDKLQF